jgi:hypothetical protein
MQKILFAFAPLVLLFAGCQGDTPPAVADADKARTALKTALDTWVKGGTIAELKNGSPTIVVSDPDWEAGKKLTKYSVDPTDKHAGIDLLVKVTLTLTSTDGKPQDKTVNFTVSLGSQTVVLRYQ